MVLLWLEICWIIFCIYFSVFETLNINKLNLEVSQNNIIAERYYNNFDFSTVGIRKNYYKDGSNGILKEKNLTSK